MPTEHQQREGHTNCKTTVLHRLYKHSGKVTNRGKVISIVQREWEGHTNCTTTEVGSYQIENNNERVIPPVQQQREGHAKCTTNVGR